MPSEMYFSLGIIFLGKYHVLGRWSYYFWHCFRNRYIII